MAMRFGAISFLHVLVVASGYRFRRGQVDKQSNLATPHHESSAILPTDKPRCQYAGGPPGVLLPARRPPWESMVAVCPRADTKCRSYGGGIFSRRQYMLANVEKMTTAYCEDLCTQDAFQGRHEGKRCLGYVLRSPFGEDLDHGAPQCHLIHSGAKRSSKFKDEIHFESSTVKNKVTFIKEYCGCSHRFVHIARPVEKTKLSLSIFKAAEYRRQADLAKHGTANQQAAKQKLEQKAEDALLKVRELREKLKQREVLQKFDGVYDWVPIVLPHRYPKGLERILIGGSLIPIFSTVLSPFVDQAWVDGFSKQSMDPLKKHWDVPVKINTIYKKTDLSAFLYRCTKKKTGEEQWYATTKDELFEWVVSNVMKRADPVDTDQIMEQLTGSLSLQISLFLTLGCIGTPLSMENTMSIGAGANQTIVQVDDAFISNREVTGERFGKTPTGCFASEQDAVSVEEEHAIKEVGQCPVDDLVRHDSEVGKKIDLAQSILKFKSVAKVIFKGAKKAGKVVGEMKDHWSKWFGQPNEEDKTGETEIDPYARHRLIDFTKAEFNMMLDRADVLVGGLSDLLNRINAASNVDDDQIKLVCSVEALDEVFRIGGLLPKLMQNIAMQPSLVRDEFVRNKLKETQNSNPLRNRSETMAMIETFAPHIELDSGNLSLTDILEYDRGLAAGSVGQVDVFTIREDLDPQIESEFRKKMLLKSEGKVIVKTVFEETKELYETDWNVLEQFFHYAGELLPKEVQTIWTVLGPMKQSIFQEFDLRHEAAFTMRGNAMLKEFTDNVNNGVYNPTLKAGDVQLTTPHALATSSPFVLIQSLAAGKPLKDHLQGISGQIEPLVEWRTKIYSSILLIFGHMVVKHGFFQSDPHNGNWFWDPLHKTITLIDWGGVEELDAATNCKLANLYHKMGSKQRQWERCEAIVLSGDQEFSGTYLRNGVSVFDAGPGEEALILGKTYEVSYVDRDSGLHMWYDGSRWLLSKARPGEQELYEDVAELKTSTSKMEDLVGQHTKWININSKYAIKLRIEPSATTCGMERREAYAAASRILGIKQELSCPPEDLVFLAQAPLTPALLNTWKDNGARGLTCIDRTQAPPIVNFGLYEPLELEVKAASGSGRYAELPNGTKLWLDEKIDVSPNYIKGIDNILVNASLRKFQALKYDSRHTAVLNLLTEVQAVAGSLFDSDPVTAALMALEARDARGVIFPSVPEVYTLLARCILVFHGMLFDVLKDTASKLIPLTYVQWFAQSQGDRFFTQWAKPAKEYLDGHNEECPVGSWDDIH